MATQVKPQTQQTAHCERKEPQGGKLYLYVQSMLRAKISIHITEIGSNIKENLEEIINEKYAGKCIEDGYVKPNSIRIHSYSPGIVTNEMVEFHVMYNCQISHPVEGQVLEAKVKTITKAGIHAQCIDPDKNIPITVFIARDHHMYQNEFQDIKEGDRIYTCVIGVRFELNDPYICVIARLIPSQYVNKFQGNRQMGGDQLLNEI
jgi:DNA-directed RNA polymerase subunit E'/Rpb7